MRVLEYVWHPGTILYLVLLCLTGWAPGALAQASPQVVSGTEGWLFLQQELRFLNVGPFWGEYAESVSRAVRADAKDPTPAIVAFHQALARKGITLLLVPVPPKALVYSEHIPVADRGKQWGESLDRYYKILREQGLQVLDLRDGFIDAKISQQQPLYCRLDTHWSGYGCSVAAELIAEKIAPLLPGGTFQYTRKWRDIQISGDLQLMQGTDQGMLEELTVGEIQDKDGKHPESDPSSPVLVLGDSHVLVFHEGGDMYARGSGITDQLAYQLGVPVDVIGVRGSGATPARINLYRKVQRTPGYWEGKKVVVWCFAAREFTETDGWRIVPVEP